MNTVEDKSSQDKDLEDWRLEKKIEKQFEIHIAKYDKALRETLETMFLVKLQIIKSEMQKFNIAYSIGKWVVATVAVLVIGTLYQLFVTLVNLAGGLS